MALHPLPKKLKLEENGAIEPLESDQGGECSLGNSIQEQEEALIALIEHRTREVEQLNYKASYYRSEVLQFSTLDSQYSIFLYSLLDFIALLQAEATERKLQESQLQLARLRASSGPAGSSRWRVESPAPVNGVAGRSETKALSYSSRQPLVIPSIKPKLATTKAPLQAAAARSKPSSFSQSTPKASEKLKKETTTVRSSEKRKLGKFELLLMGSYSFFRHESFFNASKGEDYE